MENLNDLGEYLNTEIVCTLAGLGYSEGSEYFKSPDCLGRLAMLEPSINTSLIKSTIQPEGLDCHGV